MADKFLNRYRISSARLSTWDYSSNAAYFLTMCTANRQHYFGKIEDSEMQLSKIGEYALECWMKIPAYFPYFYLDAFVIMPNHVHGIVLIEKPFVDRGRDSNVVAHALSLRQSNSAEPGQSNYNEPQPRHFRFRNQGKNTISGMIGSFKSAVSKYCNENSLSFGWQSRFHDHIIRDKEEFYQIRNYIIHNAINWNQDQFYTIS